MSTQTRMKTQTEAGKANVLTSPERLRTHWFYYLAAFTVRNYARLFLGLRVYGAENIPKTPGLVVASNHFSHFDPPVIGSLIPREVHFMAKKELFESQPMRWLAEHLMAFPVDRSKSDMRAIKEALRYLKEGLAVGIFPQGTRKAANKDAHGGAAFLAQRAGVPLLPAAIWREGHNFRVSFGEPIAPQGRSREEMSALTQELMARIEALLPENAEESG